MFGLFTKMDAAFQTEWLKLLSHLGPVFSYFVGCLWDKEVSDKYDRMNIQIIYERIIGICKIQSLRLDPNFWNVAFKISLPLLGSLFFDSHRPTKNVTCQFDDSIKRIIS